MDNNNISLLVTAAKKQITAAKDLQVLNEIRVEYLGKKGKLTHILKSLASIPQDQCPRVGEALNKAKAELLQLIKNKTESITHEQLNSRQQKEVIDVTLQGRGQELGSLHPVTKVRIRLEKLLGSMGFTVVEGPEIEDEFHNFTALNIPEEHPARSGQDTFYLADRKSKYLLRTQTSPVQVRAMETMGVPLRIVTPGRVYRRDLDATHVPMFHQLEGLLVDDHTTFAELKGLLYDLLKNFFEEKIKLRFRPSYFPFTEPSAEVDLECIQCKGKGCNLCKESGWIEVLGCGMVHPNVFQAVGVDSERYTGFAFGIGMDRFALFRYQFTDLRMLFENDVKFLQQF